ncbi:MAG: hypothetical protein JWP91_3442 [Fibrobacteres bacterium]|nr:hypothetical protein [Fibrobacterota bacterium]
MFPILLTFAILSAVAGNGFAVPQGRWQSYTQSQIPTPSGEAILRVDSDPQGILYLTTANATLTYDGSVFAPFTPLRAYPNRFWIGSRTDYWVSETHYWPLTYGEVIQVKDGTRKRAGGCLAGNDFRILGKDAQGRLLVDERMNYGAGSWAPAVVRLSEVGCDTIDIGIGPDSEDGAVAYARDNLGREYFATEMISDVARCGPLVRLDKGKLDTLIPGACTNGMLAVGAQVLFTAREGLWITTNSGSRKIEKVKGRTIGWPMAPFRDSKGVIWLGGNLGGVLAIDGTDSVFYDSLNSDFKGRMASSFAEDAEGNIWMETGTPALNIFARGRLTVALGRHARAETHRLLTTMRSRDLLGRDASLGDLAPAFRFGTAARH